ncbi:MAG: translation elongation factor Ts [Defluviitaleaceae bacterium]|nr:translation elongation factor Ts [Defluviitaleaceae bacterium]
MAVTAAMVKELRERTGAGMSDCKNALVEAEGDFDKAVDWLREKGLAAAAKKAGRIASEGLVITHIAPDGNVGVIVEINSETDFVAKSPAFQQFVADVAAQAAASQAESMDEFHAEKWHVDPSVTVKDALTQKISTIGEKLDIRRFDRFVKSGNGALISYIHGGGRVSVLLELVSDVVNDALIEAGKNVCMQIAAMSPQFVSRKDVPADYLEKEREILTQQALNEDNPKPLNIIEKMITGRLEKNLKELCLLDQEYVKDSEMTVGKYLEAVGKEIGSKVVVERFVRYETGEGLGKREDNFAEEVSKMMGN